MAATDLETLRAQAHSVMREIEANKHDYWRFNELSAQRHDLLREIGRLARQQRSDAEGQPSSRLPPTKRLQVVHRRALQERESASGQFETAVRKRLDQTRELGGLSAQATSARRELFEARMASPGAYMTPGRTAEQTAAAIDAATPPSAKRNARPSERMADVQKYLAHVRQPAPLTEMPRPDVPPDLAEPGLRAALTATWRWLDSARKLIAPDFTDNLIRLGSNALRKVNVVAAATAMVGDSMLPKVPTNLLGAAEDWLGNQRKQDEKARAVIQEEMQLADLMRPPGRAPAEPQMFTRRPERRPFERPPQMDDPGIPNYLAQRRARRNAEIAQLEADLTETWGTFDAAVDERANVAARADAATSEEERAGLTGVLGELDRNLSWLLARGRAMQSEIDLFSVEEASERMMLAPGGEWDEAEAELERLSEVVGGLQPAAAPADRRLPAAPIPDTPPEDATLASQAETEPPADGESYVIQAGDTLEAIAERFGTTVDELVSLNSIQDPDRIYVGATLQIPGAVAAASDNAASLPPEQYLSITPAEVETRAQGAVALRMNNPMALRWNRPNNWEGRTTPQERERLHGADTVGQYEAFTHPAWGIRAAVETLDTYNQESEHDIENIYTAIQRWSPAADDNAPREYADAIIARMRADGQYREANGEPVFDSRDYEQMFSMVRAMIEIESGGGWLTDEFIRRAMLMARTDDGQPLFN